MWSFRTIQFFYTYFVLQCIHILNWILLYRSTLQYLNCNLHVKWKLQYIALERINLCYTALRCIWYHTASHFILPDCTSHHEMRYTALHCTLLHYIALRYTTDRTSHQIIILTTNRTAVNYFSCSITLQWLHAPFSPCPPNMMFNKTLA